MTYREPTDWRYRTRRWLFLRQNACEDWLVMTPLMRDDRYPKGSRRWQWQQNHLWTVLEALAQAQCTVLTHAPVESMSRPWDGDRDHCAWCPKRMPWSVPRSGDTRTY